MKRLIFVFGFLICGAAIIYGSVERVLPPQVQSTAYQRYQNRPKNELSKLIYLMDRFKGTEYKVLYNQTEYDSETALQQAKNYIAKHYHQEDAIQWIQAHAYRSASGEIIYLKSTDGKTEILRDALTHELKTLNS